MIYFLWFVVLISLMQAFIAFINFLTGLKSIGHPQPFDGMVSILIPARNEEKNIAYILDDLINQSHDNLEIIVFDDQSEDRTAEIVKDIAAKDSRVSLVQSTGLPQGWLGKNHACHQLGKLANGDIFLFLDADVRLESEVVSTVSAKAMDEKLDLISIFPRQLLKSFGEWLTVPIMNHILLTLLPLTLVKRTHFSSLAAANGQFMLFNADVYRLLNPHQTMRNQKVEDIAIARFFKDEGCSVDCLASVPGVSCRMYENSYDSIQGFSKNVTHFFGNSLVLTVLFWFISFPAVVWGLFSGQLEILILLSVSIIFMRMFTSAASHQNALLNLILFFPQLFMLGLIILTSIYNQKTKSFQWKGRNIS